MPKIATRATAQLVGPTVAVDLDGQSYQIAAPSNAELARTVRRLRRCSDLTHRALAERIAIRVVTAERRRVLALIIQEGASVATIAAAFKIPRHLLADLDPEGVLPS